MLKPVTIEGVGGTLQSVPLTLSVEVSLHLFYIFVSFFFSPSGLNLVLVLFNVLSVLFWMQEG